MGRGSSAQSLVTSADALLLSRQDPRSVNDADAVQDWVGQLCTHEPAGKQSQEDIRVGLTLIQVGWESFSASSSSRQTNWKYYQKGSTLEHQYFPPCHSLPPKVHEFSFPVADLLVKAE